MLELLGHNPILPGRTPRMTTIVAACRRGFSLIELLVVVAIVALLMSILLPSFKRARDQGRETLCKSFLKQLAAASALYQNDQKGYLPGNCFDWQRDWLGSGNGRTRNNWEVNLAPQNGTLYPYTGPSDDIYFCKSYKSFREQDSTQVRRYTYTSPLLLTGAPVHILKRAIYEEGFNSPERNWKKWGSRSMMVPIFVEEDTRFWLEYSRDGGWSNDDTITDRHNRKGHLAFVDGHVEGRRFQRGRHYFNAWRMYIETTDGRIVSSGWYQDNKRRGDVEMGFILHAPSEPR